jgi:hypothetical protein
LMEFDPTGLSDTIRVIGPYFEVRVILTAGLVSITTQPGKY